MEQEDAIEAALAAARGRMEQLRLSLLELQGLRGSLPLEWSDVEVHFAEQEENVRRQAMELRAKERHLEARSREMLEAMEKQEQAMAAKEHESLLRLQNHKEETLAFVMAEKRKWKEESGVEHLGEQQEREQERYQQREDEAFDEEDDETDGAAAQGAMEMDFQASKKGRRDSSAGLAKAEVRVRPYLKSLCENMDADGLRKYVVDHRKDMGALRNEMPSALHYALEPARLVLNAVQGYYPPDAKEVTTTPATRRACILLLEGLASVLGLAAAGLDYHPLVAPDLTSLAKDLAEQWRSKLDVQFANDGNSLDAQAFLQLLATFNLASEYDEEELCNLVFAVARRKQTPALCKALNLSHKIPDIVERLTNDGKQIEALSFAHAFDMMDQIQPVALLKAYLKDARRNGPRDGSNQPQIDTLSKELAALKSVLKCIEDYKLEVEYPPSPLQKRVAHLEKTKSERKRTGGSVKGQAKRPRNGGYDRNYYNGNRGQMLDKQHQQQQQQQQQQQHLFNYSFVPQTAYDRRPATGAYASYGPAAASTGGSYLYSVDGTTIYASGVYGTQSASYSSYPYQTAYLG